MRPPCILGLELGIPNPNHRWLIGYDIGLGEIRSRVQFPAMTLPGNF